MNVNSRENVPDSVMAYGLLSNLLYQNDEARRRYHEELDTMLDTLWLEDDIESWIDSKVSLLDSHIREADRIHLDDSLDFI